MRLLFLPYALGIYIAFVLDDQPNVQKWIQASQANQASGTIKGNDMLSIEHYFESLHQYTEQQVSEGHIEE